jgi:hypothetical protein
MTPKPLLRPKCSPHQHSLLLNCPQPQPRTRLVCPAHRAEAAILHEYIAMQSAALLCSASRRLSTSRHRPLRPATHATDYPAPYRHPNDDGAMSNSCSTWNTYDWLRVRTLPSIRDASCYRERYLRLSCQKLALGEPWQRLRLAGA